MWSVTSMKLNINIEWPLKPKENQKQEIISRAKKFDNIYYITKELSCEEKEEFNLSKNNTLIVEKDEYDNEMYTIYEKDERSWINDLGDIYEPEYNDSEIRYYQVKKIKDLKNFKDEDLNKLLEFGSILVTIRKYNDWDVKGLLLFPYGNVLKNYTENLVSEYKAIYYEENNQIIKIFSKKELENLIKKMNDNDELVITCSSNWLN